MVTLAKMILSVLRIFTTGHKLDYILTYTSRSSIGFKIDRKGQLYVTAPVGVKKKEIEEIISKKKSWIERHQKRLTENSYKAEKLMILGQEYEKKLIPSIRNHIKISQDTGEILISHTPNSDIDYLIERFFLFEGHKYLLKAFEKAKKKALKKNIITDYPVIIKSYKGRWGACSQRGEISLNQSLYHLPPNLIEHIILHEFCHIKHFDHSKEFYALLKEFDVLSDFHRTQIKKYQSYIYYFRRD